MTERAAAWPEMVACAITPMFRTSPDGKLLNANAAFAHLLGYDSPATLVAKAQNVARDIYADASARGELVSALEQTGYFENREVRIRRRDGAVLWVAASGRTVRDSAGGTLHYEGTLIDITARKETEAKLRLSEEKYRTLVDHSQDGVFITQDGKFLYVNQTLAEMLGTTPEQMIGADYAAYVAPEGRQMVEDIWARRLAGQWETQAYEVNMLKQDGQTRVVASIRSGPIMIDGRLASTGTLRDVTVQKDVQAALQRSEQKYRALVDHSQDGIYIMREGKYIYVNQAFASMLGYTPDEMIGMDYLTFVAPEEHETLLDLWAQRRAGRKAHTTYELNFVKKDGKTRVVTSVSSGSTVVNGEVSSTGTIHDITAQKRMEAELRYNATHDPLTDLPNRTVFVGRLDLAIARSLNTGTADYSVLFLDLDSFKVINDSLGHAAGDRLIVSVAQRLTQAIGEGETVARFGGDEFTVLVEKGRDPVQTVELIQQALREPIQLGDKQLYVHASIGVVRGRMDYSSTEEVLRDADTALYRAKAGDKPYVIFDEDMHLRAQARLQLETEMQRALDRSEFRLFYQPIVELPSERVTGFEALLRWQHPERGLLAPDDFLTVAEETGLIVSVGWWAMREACRQLQHWRRLYPHSRPLTVAVNLSHKQFHFVGLPQRVRDTLEDTTLEPDALDLEVTEKIFLAETGSAEDMLGRLKTLGISLHLDDFGTGYSSLSYLSALPLDALKIDRTFVTDIAVNPKHAAIVRTVIELARRLGMRTIAEGVETRAQLEVLNNLGCEYGQGYLFGRPLMAADAEELLVEPALVG